MQNQKTVPPIITFLPIQEGEGTPSPSNVRPILAPLNLDGIGEVYGGELDTLTGVLTETHYCCKMGEFAASAKVDVFLNYLVRFKNATSCFGDSISTHFIQTPVGNWGWMSSNEGNFCLWIGSDLGFSSSDLGLSSAAAWRTWFADNNVKIVNTLASPVAYQLTAVQYNQAIKQLKPYY